jgi:hypothetical protein
MTTRSPDRQLATYLEELAGDHRGQELLEIRYATGRGTMHRRFVPTWRLHDAARAIRSLAAHADVYCGVLLRARRAGGRDAVTRSHLAFVEIDQADAIDRLNQFQRPPTMVVTSGSPGHAHAYWRLRKPIDADALEQTNRTLARHLGGDLACVDAARILRPPASWNHKHSPPDRVELLEFQPQRRYRIDELVTGLAEPSEQLTTRVTGPRRMARTELDRLLLAIPAHDYVRALAGASADRSGKMHCPFHELSGGEATAGGVLPARSLADASSNDRVWPDPLLLVPPPVYFERLTGLRVGRSGKLRCLFHDDQHPSLHVYPEAGRGWYCFGCGRGGSVYDLAALLSGRKTRGADFVELRRELEELLL